MNDVILSTCKELIDDAKIGCVDIVFKDTCLEILAKAKQVLPPDQYEDLSVHATKRILEKSRISIKKMTIS